MEEHLGKRLRDLESEVARLLRRQAAANINTVLEERLSFGDRMADALAKRAGSWAFIGSFLLILAVWMGLNAVGAVHHWDAYPFILLNLVLSCVAAFQAPVIMMSQNRQEDKDRLRAENDFEVNVKAELLLEHLTEEVEAVKRGLLSLGADLSRNDTGDEDSTLRDAGAAVKNDP